MSQEGRITEYQEAIDSIIERLYNVGDIQSKTHQGQQDERPNDELLQKLFQASLQNQPRPFVEQNSSQRQRQAWTQDEQYRFCQALELYGRDAQAISDFVKTRNKIQIHSHMQKYLQDNEKCSRGVNDLTHKFFIQFGQQLFTYCSQLISHPEPFSALRQLPPVFPQILPYFQQYVSIQLPLYICALGLEFMRRAAPGCVPIFYSEQRVVAELEPVLSALNGHSQISDTDVTNVEFSFKQPENANLVIILRKHGLQLAIQASELQMICDAFILNILLKQIKNFEPALISLMIVVFGLKLTSDDPIIFKLKVLASLANTNLELVAVALLCFAILGTPLTK